MKYAFSFIEFRSSPRRRAMARSRNSTVVKSIDATTQTDIVDIKTISQGVRMSHSHSCRRLAYSCVLYKTRTPILIPEFVTTTNYILLDKIATPRGMEPCLVSMDASISLIPTSEVGIASFLSEGSSEIVSREALFKA